MGENVKFKQSNTIQWHDLTEDPNDLPESSIFNEVLNENGTKVYYDNVNKAWYMFFNNFITRANTPKLWCEIPKLENKTEPQELCDCETDSPVFPEQDLEKTDLIKQLAKCSDRIKELEKILCLSKVQDFMKEFPNITSPCKICNNYNNETYDTTKCIDCCYYYGSQFEIKEIK